MRREPLDDRPSFVYRAYDAHNCLLYVGCTYDVKARLKAHEKRSDWWPFLSHFETVGPFPRRQALDIEDEAMRTEAPWFNCTPAQRLDVQANSAAAHEALARRGLKQYVHCIHGGRPACRLAMKQWDIELAAAKAALASEYPFETPESRLAAYLGAHEMEAAA